MTNQEFKSILNKCNSINSLIELRGNKLAPVYMSQVKRKLYKKVKTLKTWNFYYVSTKKCINLNILLKTGHVTKINSMKGKSKIEIDSKGKKATILVNDWTDKGRNVELLVKFHN